MKNEATSAMAAAMQNTPQDKTLKLSPLGTFFNMIAEHKKEMERLGIKSTSSLPKPEMDKRKDGDPPETLCRSLCFVMQGKCHVRIPKLDLEMFVVRPGEHFGASDLL
jgi:hypothetical protein